MLLNQPWSLQAAHGSLSQALNAAGLLAPPALKAVRMGENAIFLDSARGIILRVGRSTRDYESWNQQLQLVTRLIAAGAPLNEPAPYQGLPNPIQAGSHTITTWTYELSTGAATSSDLGTALRRLHGVRTTRDVTEAGIPTWEPIERTTQRLHKLTAAGLLQPPQQTLLELVVESLRDSVPTWASCQPHCVLHADAHTGNLIRTARGPVLVDTDTLSWGPELWDTVPTFVSMKRFGLTAGAWAAYLEAAGIQNPHDLEPAVALRELDMLLWLWQQKGSSDAIDAELELRYHSLSETGEGCTQWTAF